MGLGQKKLTTLNLYKYTSPIILDVNYNLKKGIKEVKYLITEHKYDIKDKYVSTTTKNEIKSYPLLDKDVKHIEYIDLMKSIKEDVYKVNLDNINSKEDVINISSLENISNTEKKRRAVQLCKRIVKEKRNDNNEPIRYSLKTRDFI